MADLSWLEATVKILAESESAMHYTDIAKLILEKGLKNSAGATPANSVNVAISRSIKLDPEHTPFVRVNDGEYFLREKITDQKLTHQPTSTDNETNLDTSVENQPLPEQERYTTSIIQAFGMFWERDLVQWNNSPNLLGKQLIGAMNVNFTNQLGIYLLYDGKEVVYVGRSTERPLGKRLFEHTQDRLRGRWNRFSWFGLLAVKENGELEQLPIKPSFEFIISTLEALLIEGLEPPQNRKRGDDFNAIEYLQAEDPEIERQQTRKILAEMMNKFS